MTVQIDYNKPAQFLGRNGVYKMAGILIMPEESVVKLRPITSKGNIGRAFITIPNDYVQQVAQTLAHILLK